MSYKSILVHVEKEPAASPACRLLPALAKCLEAQAPDAHMAGLVLSVMPSLPGYAYHPMVSDALEVQKEAVRNQAEANAKAFRSHLAQNGLEVESRLADCLSTDCVEVIGLHGRYGDLIVMSQNDLDQDEAWTAGLPEEVAITSGRPVLLAPRKESPDTLGKVVTLAWNASQEAARAVSDALPFLVGAEVVKIVTYDAEGSGLGHGPDPGADIAHYLSRHGCKVEVHARDAANEAVGDCLLRFLIEQGSDLLVMGAYGHSRFREKLFGGVTKCVLEKATLPVLLSH